MPRPSFSMLSSPEPDNFAVNATWEWEWECVKHRLELQLPTATAAFELNDLIGQAYQTGCSDGRTFVINEVSNTLSKAL